MAKSDAIIVQAGRPRDKVLDDTLIRVTLQVLSETGLEGVTFARIGRLSGIPATSIYRRYPDARSLVLAAIQADLDQTRFDLEDQGSLRADLLAFMRVITKALYPERARMLAGLLLPVQADPTLEAMLTAKLDTLRNEGWRGAIERAVQRGTLRREALGAQPLDDVAHTMIFHQAVVMRVPADEAFLNRLLDNVLMPALEPFRI
jgi:AcrR family transcriptional regulator